MVNFGLYWFVLEIKHLDFCGWGNGYVLIPKKHPWYGVDYDMLPVHIHGGLTFSEFFQTNYIEEWLSNKDIVGDINLDNYKKFENYWMIGFDTAHLNDNKINCSKYYVIDETKKLLEQCLNDSFEDIKIYKNIMTRNDKLIKIASVLALSSKQ